MGDILLGVIALIAIILLLRAFVKADPKALARALRYAGAGVLAILAVWLIVTERFAIGVFLASMAWGLFTRGHIWPGGWPYHGQSRRSRASPHQTTQVRTSWLAMELDHDSGEMRGTVLMGVHAGKRLDELGRDDVVELLRQTNLDEPESARLLEAYLDRTYGTDWRVSAQDKESKAERTGSRMSHAEALEVLGLEEGASDEDIRAAHRRLMLQNHPDKGGTDYIAAKINEAKEILLAR